jgi:hypothetical protein
MECDAGIGRSIVIGISMFARCERSRASLLKLALDPWSEIVVASASKDSTPKYELRAVNSDAQVIHLWLEEDRG